MLSECRVKLNTTLLLNRFFASERNCRKKRSKHSSWTLTKWEKKRRREHQQNIGNGMVRSKQNIAGVSRKPKQPHLDVVGCGWWVVEVFKSNSVNLQARRLKNLNVKLWSKMKVSNFVWNYIVNQPFDCGLMVQDSSMISHRFEAHRTILRSVSPVFDVSYL